jgi:antirestriction protein ArdC
MKREDAKQLITDGLAQLNDALSQGRSETLEKYLTVMSRFHRYSFGNLLLILSQFEAASFVAGFHKWKELGRHVKKGEKAIGIFAPCRYKRKVEDDNGDERETQDVRGFRVVHVFDISQTEGEDLPEFAQIQGDAGENLARLEHVVRDVGIDLRYERIPGSVKGVSSGGTITLEQELSRPEKFAVLIHEHAHELLHQQTGRKHECSKTVRETEAEAVAFVVCHAFGLDSKTRSSDYIQLYRGSTETLAESLDLIQKTAAGIIEAINAVQLECEHTLHHKDDGGNPQGSWVELDEGELVRVECRSCGKFFGNQPKPERNDTVEEQEAA